MSNGKETDTKEEVPIVSNLQMQTLMGEFRRMMREENTEEEKYHKKIMFQCWHCWKEIVPLLFEESSKFKIEKINLKYKIDADKLRRIQLYKLEDEFLQEGGNDTEWKLE